MPEENRDLFKIFSQNESKIAELYALYALTIPSQEKMWTRLSGEEIKHSMALLKLDTTYHDDEKSYSAIPEARNILNYVGEFINQQIADAKESKISAQQAIAVAMRLELSMIERKCFDLFSTAETEIIVVLERLNKETESHFKQLKIYADKFGIFD
jgi:hypothetical protein